MQQLTNKVFDEKPNDVVVSPTIVDVLKRCEPFNQTDENTGKVTVKFECDIDRYTTTEYIDKMHSDNVSLNSQVNTALEGLVEVYEMLLG